MSRFVILQFLELHAWLHYSCIYSVFEYTYLVSHNYTTVACAQLQAWNKLSVMESIQVVNNGYTFPVSTQQDYLYDL